MPSPADADETPPTTTSAAALTALLARMPDAPLGVVLDELAKTDPVIWCMTSRRLRGHPLIFDNGKALTPAALADLRRKTRPDEYEREVHARLLRHRPFIMQPMRDEHPHKVYEKGRQIGISETSLSEEIHFLWSHPGTKVVHTFPRDTQLRDFSTTRIAEAFQETPRMRALLGIPNQVYAKRIGDSFLLLRSAWEAGLGEGIDVDIVTLDEKDRMREGVDVAFRESMKSSKYGWLREVSTPTLPGRGVDASFLESDQHSWMVRCTRCTLEQEVDYPDNILQLRDIPLGTKELPPDSYAFVCRKTKCRGTLDRLTGRWVPKRPDRKNIRGYWMPQSIAPWLSATRLMQDKINYKFHSLWMNYCMGRPARGESMLLADADFDQASAGHPVVTRRTRDWSDISIGIDWGHINWVVVMARNVHNQRFYVINVGMFEDSHTDELRAVKSVESFIAPYAPDIIIADAGYGKDRNAYLLRKFSPRGEGRFYAQWYNSSTKNSRTFVPQWSTPEQARVTIDRTMAIKVICRAIKDREFGLPDLGIDKVNLLRLHFKALAPVMTEEDGEIFEEIKATGDDHLVHASISAWLGLDALTKSSRFTFDFV